MIYEFFRFMAGPYLNRAIDYYTLHQSFFNICIVMIGFGWIVYNKKISVIKK